MTTKKIPFNYDINRMLAVDLIAIIHIDDYDTRFLELTLFDDGTPFSVDGCTVTSRFVTISGNYLLSDNVPCEATGNTITIPIDAAAVQMMACDIKIEVNIVDGEKILTLPFPLWVRVRGSILETAHVTPESQGTIPELLKDAADALEEATQALEQAGDYDSLEHKPQINGNTLSGNKTSDELGLQKKLTAGTNISIGDDGTISASVGVPNYNSLTNKPRIRAFKRNSSSSSFNDLKGILGFNRLNFEYVGNEGEIEIKLTDKVFISHTNTFIGYAYDFNKFESAYAIAGVFFVMNKRVSNLPSAFTYFDTSNSARSYIFHYFEPTNQIGVTFQIIRQVIYIDTNGNTRNFIQLANATKNSDNSYSVSNTNGWLELGSGGSQIVSGVVNQDGTITFTDSDGNTFTTSGSSVIGDDGFSPVATVTQTASGATVSITDKNGTTTANISNGADGQDYVLTNQDKTDIANIVLGELPTTQGVLYGD